MDQTRSSASTWGRPTARSRSSATAGRSCSKRTATRFCRRSSAWTPQGQLLVGKAARNQYVLAPERTVRSIKRKMGQEVTVALGDQKYRPRRSRRSSSGRSSSGPRKRWGIPVSKAVITVPAFFNDGQRQATRQAGELAGLEVVRIINEPTAAVLTYDPHPPEMERLLVYDLGGGTFDVSVAQVENGVVEILASHGDTQLGGDDFDQLLLDHVCDCSPTSMASTSGSLRGQGPRPSCRRGRQEAAVVRRRRHVEEEFIAEKNGKSARPRDGDRRGTNTRT